MARPAEWLTVRWMRAAQVGMAAGLAAEHERRSAAGHALHFDVAPPQAARPPGPDRLHQRLLGREAGRVVGAGSRWRPQYAASHSEKTRRTKRSARSSARRIRSISMTSIPIPTIIARAAPRPNAVDGAGTTPHHVSHVLRLFPPARRGEASLLRLPRARRRSLA